MPELILSDVNKHTNFSRPHKQSTPKAFPVHLFIALSSHSIFSIHVDQRLSSQLFRFASFQVALQEFKIVEYINQRWKNNC